MSEITDYIRRTFEPTTLVFVVKQPWWKFWKVERWRMIRMPDPKVIAAFMAIDDPMAQVETIIDVWREHTGERLDPDRVDAWWLESDYGVPYAIDSRAFGFGPASKEFKRVGEEHTQASEEEETEEQKEAVPI